MLTPSSPGSSNLLFLWPLKAPGGYFGREVLPSFSSPFWRLYCSEKEYMFNNKHVQILYFLICVTVVCTSRFYGHNILYFSLLGSISVAVIFIENRIPVSHEMQDSANSPTGLIWQFLQNYIRWCGLRPSVLRQDQSRTKKISIGLGLAGLGCVVKNSLVTLVIIMILKDTATFQVLFIVSLFCACNITTVEINSGVYLLKS